MPCTMEHRSNEFLQIKQRKINWHPRGCQFGFWTALTLGAYIATVVSSIIIIVIASNSQGSHAGLLSMPVAAIILGAIGIAFSAMALHRIVASDLNN